MLYSWLFGTAKMLGPWALTFLKDVLPLINDKKNRQQLEDLFQRLHGVARSKTRAGRLNKFGQLLNHASEKADTPAEKEKVEKFRRRADRLQLALEGAEYGDRKARQQRRKAWDARFESLLSDFTSQFFDWDDEEADPEEPQPGPPAHPDPDDDHPDDPSGLRNPK